jgi:polyhydroxyalkanoate synthesis regulator protein
MRMFTPFAAGASNEEGKPEAGKPGRKDVELEELKSQLADMQSRLAKLSRDS